MFFDRLDPAAVAPAWRVGRDEDLAWLTGLLARALEPADPPVGRVVCLTGPAGSGKSILARAAVEALAAARPEALALVVDCGACRGRRGVLEALCGALIAALDRRRRSCLAARPLTAAASLLRTLIRFKDVPLRVVHEQVRPLRPGLDPAVSPRLLTALRVGFGLSFELTDKQIKRATGFAVFDGAGLTQAAVALLADVRAAGLPVLLLLDELDGLQPGREGDADGGRRALEGALALRAAPVGCLLTLRPAATAALPRDVTSTRALRPLSPSELQAALALRLSGERPALQERLARPTTQAAIAQLAGQAPTPRAFLRWVKFLFESSHLEPECLEAGFAFFLESDYAAFEAERLRAVAWSFPRPDAEASAEALLAACEGDASLLELLVARGVLLPRDPWRALGPYRLDPELSFLHPALSPGSLGSALTGEVTA